jgi:hypothetical protein
VLLLSLGYLIAGKHDWNENNAVEGSGIVKKLLAIKKEKPHDTILSNVIL